MAFFNLWSSERLSFSLSVVAVVSAAITTYHQFYNQSTQVSIIPHHISSIPEATWKEVNDTIAFECTFLNSGSNPVGVIASRIFLTTDSALYRQNHEMGDHSLDWQTLGSQTIQTSFHRWNQRGYLPAQSVVPIRFETAFDSTSLARLVNRATIGRDSTVKVLNAGVWLKMVDPHGQESTMAVTISRLRYKTNTTICTGWSTPDTTIRVPAFGPPRQSFQ